MKFWAIIRHFDYYKKKNLVFPYLARYTENSLYNAITFLIQKLLKRKLLNKNIYRLREIIIYYGVAMARSLTHVNYVFSILNSTQSVF